MKEYVTVTCIKCGASDKNTFCEPDCTQMIERQLCFGCNLWANRFVARKNETIIEGHMYTPGNRTSGSFRGMAGRRFDIEYIAGPHVGKRITTFDLWSGGEIPAWLRPQWQDTAKFLNEAKRVNLGKEQYIEACWNPSQSRAEPYPLPHTLSAASRPL